ncbi:MAG: GDSL-type esterase/lipase family protein [Ignavibacteriales bacterium]|nr:GDSL-type esterase/lipase family protein [Ignavibacteriales bacterium]
MILMLGDSITAGFDTGKYFPAYDVLNEGISGDNTDLVIARLHRDVIAQKPDVIFILIGTNDMASLFPNEKTLSNFETILSEIQRALPAAKVFVQSILPTRELENRPISRIEFLNNAIRSIVLEKGAQFLDLTKEFTGRDGQIPVEWSEDGLHLTDKGYDRWASYLRKVFAECA